MALSFALNFQKNSKFFITIWIYYVKIILAIDLFDFATLSGQWLIFVESQ